MKKSKTESIRQRERKNLIGLMRDMTQLTTKSSRAEMKTSNQQHVSTASATTPGSPPWTPGAKKAMALAVEAAKAHGYSYVGVEHMLHGLAADDSHVSILLLEAGITKSTIAEKYDWGESKCFCGGNGWVMLVGTGAPNRKIACPDCAASPENH